MATFPPIYVISLKRTPERRLHIQRQLDTLGLEYEFVDVNDIDKYEMDSKAYRMRIARSLSIDESLLENKYAAIIDHAKTAKDKNWKNENLGQLAIVLSHIRIYDLMVKNGINRACILEDDATLLSTFPEVLRIAPKLQWDILLLASQPSNFSSAVIQKKFIQRIRIFDKDILFLSRRKINNADSSKQKAYRIKYLLEAYGVNSRLYYEPPERFIKILEEHDMKYEEIIKEIIPNKHRLSLVKHERYLRYRKLRQCLGIYTSIQLGGLPEQTSLEAITEHHCIAEPRHAPYSVTAYLVNQSAAMKWKRRALAPGILAIDQIPWEIYQNEQVKLRIVTLPCAHATYNYLVHSARRH